MDFTFTAEERELREAVLEFARGRLDSGFAEAGSADGCFRRDLWQACADFGILGLPFPREYGGGETGLLATTAVMEALGEGCRDHGLLFSLHAQMWAVMTPLVTFGTPDQRRRWLPGLTDGSVIGAHGMSEPGSGSDAYSLATRARADGDGYILNGSKTFVTNAPIADLFLLFATVDSTLGMWGVTAFLVERGTPGLSVTPPFRKLGLAGSPMGEVVLEDCRVCAASRLGAEGQGAAIFGHSMAWERSCILASQVGRMQRQLEVCLRYVGERRQFGRAIGSFQLVAAKLADMKVRLEASRLLLYRAASAQANGGDGGLDAAMAKLFISEAAVTSALDAVQIHGGYGYMEEYEAAEQLRDAVGGTLYSGTSEVQRLVIARHLGLSPT